MRFIRNDEAAKITRRSAKGNDALVARRQQPRLPTGERRLFTAGESNATLPLRITLTDGRWVNVLREPDPDNLIGSNGLEVPHEFRNASAGVLLGGMLNVGEDGSTMFVNGTGNKTETVYKKMVPTL